MCLDIKRKIDLKKSQIHLQIYTRAAIFWSLKIIFGNLTTITLAIANLLVKGLVWLHSLWGRVYWQYITLLKMSHRC